MEKKNIAGVVFVIIILIFIVTSLDIEIPDPTKKNIPVLVHLDVGCLPAVGICSVEDLSVIENPSGMSISKPFSWYCGFLGKDVELYVEFSVPAINYNKVKKTTTCYQDRELSFLIPFPPDFSGNVEYDVFVYRDSYPFGEIEITRHGSFYVG